MARPSELMVGGIYFGLAYENEQDSNLMIKSYEYLGRNTTDPQIGEFLFRFLGSDDELVLAERQLHLVLDLRALIDTLGRVHDGTYPKLNESPKPRGGHAS